ncbi:metalloregulator ArsR/SmtB family transcription factor [Halovivax sp.]|uniref:winged helix-turn-helix transcriptional regulator n=1 Tax=Halovivax sp. TaxID=1935978 RepID=UPI0025C534A3|nr:metalloregulator ArsR/SmtB family transcription factor [Halovivax sp.]
MRILAIVATCLLLAGAAGGSALAIHPVDGAASSGSVDSAAGSPVDDAVATAATVDLEDDLNDTTDDTEDDLNDTTDDTEDDLDDTTDDTKDDLDDTTDDTENDLNDTTDGLDGSLDDTTDGLDGNLDDTTDEIVDELDDLDDDLEAPLGADGDDRSSASEPTNETATGDDSADEYDAAAGADGAGDDPSPADAGDVVQAALVALLGTTIAGGSSFAGATAGGGAAGGSSTGRRTVDRVRRLAGRAASIPWETLPLSILRYSRYDDSDPLEHDERRTIYEAIEAEPGLYLSALGERREVSLSTIRHHVRILEEEGLLITEKRDGKRRYFPAAAEDVELTAALSEPAKRRVLETLADVERAHNGRIADELDVDPSTASHHLSTLAEDGLVERERDGRSIVNSLAPGVEAALAAEPETGRRDESGREPTATIVGDD